MKNAVVADHHAITRLGMRDVLEKTYPSVEIFEASTFAKTLELLSVRSWDLFLMDVVMPEGNIVDVIQKIRTSNKIVPILVVTASTEVEYVVQTMRAGANGFVHKHRGVDELLKAIKKVSNGDSYLHAETAREVALELCEKREPEHLKLSKRELEIFCMIAHGQTVKEIASALQLSDKTVATHLARCREKTGLKSAVEIAKYALRNNLVK